MKKHVKIIAIIMITAAGIFAGSNAFSTDVPAFGCRYSGNSSDYCVYGNMWVYNCCNNATTSCAYSITPPSID
jgi:hypothetical protein